MTDVVAHTSRVEAFAGRMVEQATAGMELLSMYVGQQLGLFSALDQHGAATPDELAGWAGIHRRYAREWLEQQAVAGVLEVEDAGDEPYERRYAVPADHRPTLLDPDSPFYTSPLASVLAAMADVLPDLLAAYRTGGGVPYTRYGTNARTAIGAMNRPVFLEEAASWVAAMPDIDQRLRDGDDPRILDLGCGTGWSTVALARAYPKARLCGVDLDQASIDEARTNAEASGFAGRIHFEAADAGGLHRDESYDLVCVFEALHDMARPVETLTRVHDVLRDGGAVLVADERVADTFTAPGDDLERLNYGFSVLHCLPSTMAEAPVVEAGTVLRPGVLREYASAAGFGSCDILPVENDLWRLYRLNRSRWSVSGTSRGSGKDVGSV